MRFMNTWEIDGRAAQYRDHPILGPATQTLANLRDAVDANSDGWAHWPKPCRAAAKLQAFIERDGTWPYRYGPREDVTATELRAAYRPIKAFRTRSGIDFKIIEPDEPV